MNNLSDYDPRWCDGHFCPKDCEVCPYRAENRGGKLMGVYIKGMEMPDNCYVCPFMFHQRRASEVWCTAIENHWLDLRKVLSCDRHDDCPLVPVQPHGRLGDLDKLENCLRHMAKYQHGERQQGILGCCETIRLAPTVIEAEEGE